MRSASASDAYEHTNAGARMFVRRRRYPSTRRYFAAIAVARRHIELEISVDDQIARLEAKTDHIQSDVTDLKAELRRIEVKVDTKVEALDKKIDAKCDALDAKIGSKCGALEVKIDTLKDSMIAFHLQLKDELAAIRKQQWIDKVWWLLIAAAILGVMARGMKWI
jgi:hypothetical protein